MKPEIRQLSERDWEIFRAIRLKALQECERVYLSSYEDTLKRTPEEWQEIIAGDDRAIFVLFANEKPIGLASVFTWKDDASKTTGVMAMGYLVPDHRGKGFSRLLYEPRIAWAKQHPVFAVCGFRTAQAMKPHAARL